MAETYSLTPHESVTVRSHTPEHFELLAGQLETRVGDEQRTLTAGDALDVPAGTPHQMWNASGEPARVLWQIRPAGRTREWFATLDRLRREGRVGRLRGYRV